MNDKFLKLLKSRDLVVPEFLISKYKSFGLTAEMTLLIIYLLNLREPIVCDYQKMSLDLDTDIKNVMEKINELVEKNFIEIELKKNYNSKFEEYINLEPFYNKVFLKLIDVENEPSSSNIYSVFERELSRTLSPIEYELINGWLGCDYKEEIILEALKEAVFNGVNNFRYIDRILFDWNKKGIDSIEKIEKNRINYIKDNSKSVDVPDYDWLNNNE